MQQIKVGINNTTSSYVPPVGYPPQIDKILDVQLSGMNQYSTLWPEVQESRPLASKLISFNSIAYRQG